MAVNLQPALAEDGISSNRKIANARIRANRHQLQSIVTPIDYTVNENTADLIFRDVFRNYIYETMRNMNTFFKYISVYK